MPVERMLRPTEVAARLGVAANTLRVYSVRFAAVLGPAAAHPGAGEAGHPRHRLYTLSDLAILERARELVGSGLSYEQALARLRGEVASSSPVAVREEPGPADGPPMAALRQAMEAWQSLAEERAREVGELRARVEALRGELEQERSRRLAAERLLRLATPSRGGKPGRASSQGTWLSRIFPVDSEERPT